MKTPNYNYLHTALTLALTGTVGLTYATAVDAGIMTEDYELNLYGDFAEGKGIFSLGNTNIPIYDKTGKLKATLEKPLDVRGVVDGGYATLIDPEFLGTAEHVPYVDNITFGATRELLYNDGTLFDGATPQGLKPFTGTAPRSSEFDKLINSGGKYKEVFNKYLGVTYKRAYEINAKNSTQEWVDFKLTRVNKLIIDAEPYELPTDYSQLKNGEFVARVGAGAARIGIHGGPNIGLTLGTPIGGLDEIKTNSYWDFTDKAIHPEDTTAKKNYFAGRMVKTIFYEYGTGALESGTLAGDSGSPIFWLDKNTKKWQYLGGLSGGNFWYKDNDAFGVDSFYFSSGPWAQARINYYNAPETKLTAGQSVVIHGQNPHTGDGYLHILDQGATDFTEVKFKEDVEKVATAIKRDMHHQKWLFEQKRDYSLATKINAAQGLPPPEKWFDDNGTDPNTPVPKPEDFYNTDYTITSPGVTKQLYKGYAYGVDYSGYINENVKREKNSVLPYNPRSITFVGAGAGNAHLITFADDFAVTNGKINLGAAKITLKDGDFTISDNANPQAAITSFIHAGYDIKEGASLNLTLKGEASDAIHKIGAGTLRISGTGDQLSPLNVGDGLIILDRTNGTATPHLKLASGRAVVRLNQDGQLNMNFDGKTNNAAVGFGQDGGVLDFNGHDLNTTWIDIYHMDAGAILANSNRDASKRVNFTFAPNGKRTFLGGFIGNFNLNYSTANITDANSKSWKLQGSSEILGTFDIAAQAQVVVGDVATQRGWGQHYDDRFDFSSFISNRTNLNSQATLTVGRNALYASHITLGSKATLDVHNLGAYSDASKPYGIANQAQLEKTVLAGSVDFGTDQDSKLNLETTQGSIIDVHSALKGNGTITTLGAGTINLGGDNSQFTGRVKVCDASASTGDAACSQALMFASQAVANLQLPSTSTSSDFALSEQQQGSLKEVLDPTLPHFKASSSTPMPEAARDQLQAGNSANSRSLDLETNDTNDLARTATADSPKAQISKSEYESSQSFTSEHQQAVAQAQQNAKPVSADRFATYVPVPDANSQIINFFAPTALFSKAASFDTSNARVILRTAFANATEQDLVRWDMGQVTGDAFLVKDDASTLQLRNYNLGGTIFVNQGKLISDRIHGHIVVGKGATFLADARQDQKAQIDGRVVNSGTIYLTSKGTELPEQFASTMLTTQPVKNIVQQQGTPTLKLTLEPQDQGTLSSSASSPVLASSGLQLASLRDEHHSLLTLAESPVSSVLASSLPTSNGDILESTARKSATLEVAGDYIGQDGTIVYDLNEDYYSLKVKGKITGQTTLVVQDIAAATAQANESFKLIESEAGITQDAIKLQSTTVSGGLYDYKLDFAGDKVVLSSYVDPNHVEVVPDPAPTTPAETTPTTPTPVVREQPAPAQPQPEQPAPAVPAPDSNVAPTTQPDSGNTPANTESPTEGESATEAATPAPVVPVAPAPSQPSMEIATQAGARYINSSVGTLLANRRFITNMNLTPASLAYREGFYLDVDRDSEALEFTGARYTSSYQAKRTLIGHNFTLNPELQVGVFANLGTATSKINNQLNSATGQVQAYGIGATVGTRLGSVLELSGATQYLYAQSSVSGTHNQQENLHGSFAALQAALAIPRIGDATNFIQVKPYALLQAEFTPTSHFISRLGEDLGTVSADRYTQALGIQATVNLNKFALEVDAYKNLGTRATAFNGFYNQDFISAKNNNYRIKTTASYQIAQAVRVKTYFNAQGTQRTTGVGLDINW